MATEPNDDSPHGIALARFKLVVEAEATQRKAELDDLRFVDLEDQWPEGVKEQRAGTQSGAPGPPVPARPCLTFNLIKQPAQLLSNQQRNAKMSLQFAPKGSGASQDTAEAFEDIARGIQAESRAGLARNWAYERSTKCGRGFYRILAEWSPDGDEDQDIVYKRILNQASVYLDPYATEPDWSDARFCFITQNMPWSEYKERYPKSKLASYDDGALEGIGDTAPEWIGGDDEQTRTAKIAEYFYIKEDKDPKGRITTRAVKWCKLNCVEILDEPIDFPSDYIPVVPTIADEYNVDGQRVWQGIVRPAKDGNRSYNYMRSAMVEAIGLAPRAPFIIAEGQLEGHEAEWQQANTRNYPYLSYKQTTFGGTPAPPPQRNAVEPPIQAMAIAGNEAKEDVKTTTGVFDPSLGQLSPSERSGKAILALQKQSEMGSSGYLDNLASMSLQLEGKILKSMIPRIYNRPGRMVATYGADDQRGAVLIGVPFTLKNGEPVPLEGWVEGMPVPPEARFIDLAKGKYTVAATVGKSFTTRREEGAAAMTELASAAPQIVPLIADLWIGNMDFPGARQCADRLKKVLPPAVQESDGAADIPPQVKQQMEQMQQMLEMLTKELKSKTEIINTEAVKAQQNVQLEQTKQQAEMVKTQADNATKVRIAEIQANTQFGVAELKAGLDTAKMRLAHIEELLGHQAEARQIESEQEHDSQQMAQNRQAEAQGAEADRQFQREEGEAGRQFEAQENEAGREHETVLTGAQLAAQERQAKMKPQAGA